VIVVLEAEHLCMTMRGVRKPGAKTVTSAVRGIFRSEARTRAEAMSLMFGHRLSRGIDTNPPDPLTSAASRPAPGYAGWVPRNLRGPARLARPLEAALASSLPPRVPPFETGGFSLVARFASRACARSGVVSARGSLHLGSRASLPPEPTSTRIPPSRAAGHAVSAILAGINFP